jgi:hypothetical protein
MKLVGRYAYEHTWNRTKKGPSGYLKPEAHPKLGNRSILCALVSFRTRSQNSFFERFVISTFHFICLDCRLLEVAELDAVVERGSEGERKNDDDFICGCKYAILEMKRGTVHPQWMGISRLISSM